MLLLLQQFRPVTLCACLQYWLKIGDFVLTFTCIVNLLVRQKMIYEYCSSLTFFYLMSSSAGNTIQTHSGVYFLFPSFIVDMFETKSKSFYILILLFYICLPRVQVHHGTPISCILQLFMNTGYKFLYFIRQLIRMSIPPS